MAIFLQDIDTKNRRERGKKIDSTKIFKMCQLKENHWHKNIEEHFVGVSSCIHVAENVALRYAMIIINNNNDNNKYILV